MRDCQTETGEWRDDVRASRACGLHAVAPWVPYVRPKPTAEGLYQLRLGTAYMGRYPDRRLVGQVYLGIPIERWDVPLEDPADGCPGAWYRSPFIDSVDKYRRRRTGDGGRVYAPRFDRADHASAPVDEPDWLIQAAVTFMEDEEERRIAHENKIRCQRMERAAAKNRSPASGATPARVPRRSPGERAARRRRG